MGRITQHPMYQGINFPDYTYQAFPKWVGGKIYKTEAEFLADTEMQEKVKAAEVSRGMDNPDVVTAIRKRVEDEMRERIRREILAEMAPKGGDKTGMTKVASNPLAPKPIAKID